MKTIVILAVLFAISFAQNVILYRQCDSSWRNSKMGKSKFTLCERGSKVAALASILATWGVPCGTGTSSLCNPGFLNAWLAFNKGYNEGGLFSSGQSMNHNALNKLFGIKYEAQYSTSSTYLRKIDDDRNGVLLQLRKNGNWVLGLKPNAVTKEVRVWCPETGTQMNIKTSAIKNAVVFKKN